MSWSDYETQLMNELCRVVGSDMQQGHTLVHRELPKLKVYDLTTILTKFAPALIHALTTRNGKYGAVTGVSSYYAADRVPSSSLVDSSGAFAGDAGDIVAINAGSKSITLAQYVAGTTHDGDPAWVRCLGTADVEGPAQGDDATLSDELRLLTATQTYEVACNVESSEGGQGPIAFMRQSLVDWQTCVNIAAQALGDSFGANTELDPSVVESFHMALGKLAVDLDVMEESPPSTHNFQESWSHAATKVQDKLKDAAHAAGEAGAWVGDTVGKVAGSAASGFFSQATLLTLAVAGVAVFVLVR